MLQRSNYRLFKLITGDMVVKILHMPKAACVTHSRCAAYFDFTRQHQSERERENPGDLGMCVLRRDISHMWRHYRQPLGRELADDTENLQSTTERKKERVALVGISRTFSQLFKSFTKCKYWYLLSCLTVNIWSTLLEILDFVRLDISTLSEGSC